MNSEFRKASLPLCLLSGIVLLVVGLVLPAHSHQVSAVSVLVEIDTKTRDYKVGAAMEILPSEDATLNDEISPEDAARTFATDYLTVLFDESDQSPKMEIRTADVSDEDTPESLRREQVLVELTGKIPEGASDFLLYSDPRCPMAMIMVVIKDQRPGRRMQMVLPGEYSRPVNVEPILDSDPFEESAKAAESENSSEASESEEKGMTGIVGGGFVHFFRGSFFPLALWLLVLLPVMTIRTRIGQLVVFLSGLILGICVLARYLTQSEWLMWAAPISLLVVCGVIFVDPNWGRRRVSFILTLSAAIVVGCYSKKTDAEWAGAENVEGLLGHLAGFGGAQLVAGAAVLLLLYQLQKISWYRSALVLPGVLLLASFAVMKVLDVSMGA